MGLNPAVSERDMQLFSLHKPPLRDTIVVFFEHASEKFHTGSRIPAISRQGMCLFMLLTEQLTQILNAALQKLWVNECDLFTNFPQYSKNTLLFTSNENGGTIMDTILKISGFIVGVNSNPQSLILRVCDTLIDENDCSWAIASIENEDTNSMSRSAQLLKLTKGLLDLNIEQPSDNFILYIIQCAIANRRKVWLTLKEKTPSKYSIENIKMKDA